MRKNDLVKRVKKSERTFYNEMELDSIGIIVKGPYEKNVSDIIYAIKPWLKQKVRYTEIKMVIDILSENRVYKHCVIEEYERVKS
ncbi:MAG: hypothetical protein CMB77_03870 [Euryarchaeota archaeon]|nr:hypothetical protein [Euryarchaeota archaeon]|tara:strand:- start:52741 stop:52995 length:255 start_codon:yes stop_codon:yes gene_type:complete